MRWAASGDGCPAIFTIGLALAGLVLGLAAWTGVLGMPKSPSAVVQGFYEAANQNDWHHAEQYLSQDARSRLQELNEAERAVLFERLTNGYTIEEVYPANLRNYGRRAVVSVLVFSDGEGSPVRVDETVREGAQWRITWPIGERQWNDLVESYDRIPSR